MKHMPVYAVLVFVLFAGLIFTGCPTDGGGGGVAVEGTWSGPLTSDGVEGLTLILNIIQDGDDLSGNGAIFYGGEDPIATYTIDLTISGDHITGMLLGDPGFFDIEIDAMVDGSMIDGTLYIPASDVSGFYSLTKL
jgi:hypothetical protein